MSVRKVITKSGDVKWEVRVWTSGRASKRMVRRFDKKPEAMGFLDDYQSRLREYKKPGICTQDFEETTFEAEAAYWLLHRKKEFSVGHLKRVNGILAEFLPKYGMLPPNRFQPALLSEIQNEQLNRGKLPATANRKTEVITAILCFSAKHRRIPFDPSVGFKKLKRVRHGVSFWERHEAEMFLAYAAQKYGPDHANRWVYAAYLVALNTALRAGETWGLMPQDIVQDGELLYVRRQFCRVSQTLAPLKCKMPPRNVPCNREVGQELLALIKQGNLKPGALFFQRPGGRAICHETFVRQYFDRDVKEARVRRIRFHDLRHTATTLMIANGQDLKTVKEICGHKDIATTMGYTHLLGNSIRDVARSFSISATGQGQGFKEPGRSNLRLIGISG